MKKAPFYLLLSILFISLPSHAANTKTFQGNGEVVTVDPLYSRITIETGPIKGYSGGGRNEFVAASADLLKDLSARDLVEFEITEVNREAKIDKIKKTGVANEKDSGTPIGQAAQEILNGAGNAVKTVTSPIPAIHDTVGEAVGTATEGTGNLVKDVKSDAKRDF